MEISGAAMKRLSFGRGNALSIGERIRNLGVKTKKAMPSMLVEDVPVVAQAEDSDENDFLENGDL